MRRLVLAIVIIYAVSGYNSLYPDAADAAGNEPGHSRPANEVITNKTDIHYSKKYCTACHDRLPAKGEKYLKYGGDSKQLCSCHHDIIGRDLHPVGIVPSDEIKPHIPSEFPLQNGKVDCITCHDIFAQCRDNRDAEISAGKQLFLRGAPYKDLTMLCFKCHNQVKFEKYNPHKQLDKNGDIVELKCLYCHLEVPDVKKSEYEDIKLIGNMDILCDRCHNKMKEQSLHSRHLRRPSAKVLARIKQMEVEFDIVLPLNDQGGITCATCHNPHQKGVIPDKRAGAKGADAKLRSRFEGNICIKCHNMG